MSKGYTWIPVTSRLPTIGSRYLVVGRFTGDHGQEVGMWWTDLYDASHGKTVNPPTPRWGLENLELDITPLAWCERSPEVNVSDIKCPTLQELGL